MIEATLKETGRKAVLKMKDIIGLVEEERGTRFLMSSGDSIVVRDPFQEVFDITLKYFEENNE